MTPSDEARCRASELLRAGLLGGAPPSAEVLSPIPIVDPDEGALHTWYLPISVGDRLVGFAELRPDLELLRYSSFPRPVELAVWTDPDAVRQRAAELTSAGETLGDPVLSYDREPSRIAWLVTATSADGHTRRLVVTGDFVYEGRG